MSDLIYEVVKLILFVTALKFIFLVALVIAIVTTVVSFITLPLGGESDRC